MLWFERKLRFFKGHVYISKKHIRLWWCTLSGVPALNKHWSTAKLPVFNWYQVIPFDAAHAACRVCARDGANWVCVIAKCCEGNSMKGKASGSCGTHPWRRQTLTLLPHLQSELDEYAPSATALFHIKPWKVSKSHKGQRTESCATCTIKKKQQKRSQQQVLQP